MSRNISGKNEVIKERSKMSLVVPERALAQLRASKAASEKLSQAVRRSRNTWTSEQEEQLGLVFQVIKDTNDALVNIVGANT